MSVLDLNILVEHGGIILAVSVSLGRRILYTANPLRWKSFMVFVDRLVTMKLSSEIACAVGFGHARLPSNHKCFPANYSLFSHTVKLFHFKWFAIYGIRRHK